MFWVLLVVVVVDSVLLLLLFDSKRRIGGTIRGGRDCAGTSPQAQKRRRRRGGTRLEKVASVEFAHLLFLLEGLDPVQGRTQEAFELGLEADQHGVDQRLGAMPGSNSSSSCCCCLQLALLLIAQLNGAQVRLGCFHVGLNHSLLGVRIDSTILVQIDGLAQ